MSNDLLEIPDSPDDLYLAASPDEVEAARPYMTGDVFRDVSIPGVESTGHGIVLTHPCSMRSNGIDLAKRLLVARVAASDQIPLDKWRDGYFKVMPLPGMLDGHFSAKFNEIGLVRSQSLLPDERMACLTPLGINLLQQRFIWYLTRFFAPTNRLNEAAESVFEEAELLEEWISTIREAGGSDPEGIRAFHEWIRIKDATGNSRQDLLADPQRRAGVRQEMRHHLSARICIDNEYH